MDRAMALIPSSTPQTNPAARIACPALLQEDASGVGLIESHPAMALPSLSRTRGRDRARSDSFPSTRRRVMTWARFQIALTVIQPTTILGPHPLILSTGELI